MREMKKISLDQLNKLLRSVAKEDIEIIDDEEKIVTCFYAAKKEGQTYADKITVISTGGDDDKLVSLELSSGDIINDGFLHFDIDKENRFFVLDEDGFEKAISNMLVDEEFVFNGLTIDFFGPIISVYDPKQFSRNSNRENV